MNPATQIRNLRIRPMQEREEPADRTQAYHSHEESSLPAQSFFTHEKGETCARTYLAGDEQLRRDRLFLQEQLSEQNRDLHEAHVKSLHEMEELSSVQESRVDESSRRRLIESQDAVNELTARIQELQNEVNCLNESRDFS